MSFSTRQSETIEGQKGSGALAVTDPSHHPLNRPGLWALLFLLGRGVLLLSLPYEALKAYGDLWNFYRLAAMPGWPYLDYWAEFPPLYPFLAEVFYRLGGGQEHAFVYLHVLGMTLAQAGSVYLLARLVQGRDVAFLRLAFYVFLHMGLFYTWGYFDALAVFFLLLGLWAGLRNRPGLAGLALGLGGLTKWFPLVVLLVFLPHWGVRKASWRRVGFVWGAAWFVVVGVWEVLWLWGCGYTQYSWRAQSRRPPWESPWALFHGRLATGNFPAYGRTQPPPLNATFPAWERALPWAAFAALLLLGFGLFRRRRPFPSAESFLPRTAWVLGAFFLTSWGYSPQWVLYTLPLFLLVLPWPTAALWSLLWLLLHLLEWPLTLSRGWFEVLWVLVPVRLFVLGLGMGLTVLTTVARSSNRVRDRRMIE